MSQPGISSHSIELPLTRTYLGKPLLSNELLLTEELH